MIPIQSDEGEREKGECDGTNLDKERCTSVDGPGFVPVVGSSEPPDCARSVEVMLRNLGEWEGPNPL